MPKVEDYVVFNPEKSRLESRTFVVADESPTQEENSGDTSSEERRKELLAQWEKAETEEEKIQIAEELRNLRPTPTEFLQYLNLQCGQLNELLLFCLTPPEVQPYLRADDIEETSRALLDISDKYSQAFSDAVRGNEVLSKCSRSMLVFTLLTWIQVEAAKLLMKSRTIDINALLEQAEKDKARLEEENKTNTQEYHVVCDAITKMKELTENAETEAA